MSSTGTESAKQSGGSSAPTAPNVYVTQHYNTVNGTVGAINGTNGTGWAYGNISVFNGNGCPPPQAAQGAAFTQAAAAAAASNPPGAAQGQAQQQATDAAQAHHPSGQGATSHSATGQTLPMREPDNSQILQGLHQLLQQLVGHTSLATTAPALSLASSPADQAAAAQTAAQAQATARAPPSDIAQPEDAGEAQANAEPRPAHQAAGQTKQNNTDASAQDDEPVGNVTQSFESGGSSAVVSDEESV